MDWFFADNIGTTGDSFLITGEDALHITRSLRMSVGEVLTLCDNNQNEHLCKIERISSEGVQVRICSTEECTHEPSIRVTLYFALTKGDKPETVIQKCVELGVSEIVPVLTDRCVSRPDRKSADKKFIRYNKIALQAAMQSRRGIIPKVKPMTDLKAILPELSTFDKVILFYEGGGEPLRTLITPEHKNIAVFIGPEGGFEEREVELLLQYGAKTATLGKRILRAETAPLAALSAIMFHTKNLE
ncbi:MAG: 16S rRNA (uracil(1498)-N(3))-methyltransferase [Clostridia bacterium]|nr:16S rRNA (uracil(1498)-N(3))-methyltransferase [Clostridia bacterium]